MRSAHPGRGSRGGARHGSGEAMLWAIVVVLLVLWLLGFIGHIGGSLIHLVLVIAAIVLVVQLLSGRRRGAL